jgi:hypothetical protein
MNIEFEITLRCNAKCPCCSRHCHYGLYGHDSDVTLEQTERFIEEVKGHGGVDIIHVMGGEPVLNPYFRCIVLEVKDKLLGPGHIKRLQVVTNGKIPIPDDFIVGVGICISREEEKAHKHRCMFVAPYDTGQELKHCPVPKDCGVSFGAFGWWPCGAGGAIARLFGLNQYSRETIPKDIDDFPEINTLCDLCQAKAKNYMFCKDYGDIRSVSFRKAFERFDANKLWRY